MSVTDKAKSIMKTLNDYGELENIEFSTVDAFRSEVSKFVVSQMRTIAKQDKFRDIVIQELIGKIEEHQLDAKELLSVYRAISGEKSNNTLALMDIFKPTSQAGTPLLQSSPEDEKDDITKNLTPEQYQIFADLARKLSKKEEDTIEERDIE